MDGKRLYLKIRAYSSTKKILKDILNELEKKLKIIYNKLESLNKEEHSWHHVIDLYNEFEKTYSNAKREEITKDIEVERLMFFGEIHQAICEFMEALSRGEEMPPLYDEDLNFFQEIAEKGPQMLDLLEKQTPLKDRTKEQKDFFARIEKDNKELKELVQQEKKKRLSGNKENQQLQQKQKEVD